jgi:predicted RNase H-like HicB family nuclease
MPGLGAARKTLDELKELIREAIEFHLEGMPAPGDPIPAPSGLQPIASAPKSSSGHDIPELG